MPYECGCTSFDVKGSLGDETVTDEFPKEREAAGASLDVCLCLVAGSLMGCVGS